jgi:hypothetical protein
VQGYLIYHGLRLTQHCLHTQLRLVHQRRRLSDMKQEVGKQMVVKRAACT